MHKAQMFLLDVVVTSSRLDWGYMQFFGDRLLRLGSGCHKGGVGCLISFYNLCFVVTILTIICYN